MFPGSLEPAISLSPESDAFLPQNFGVAEYLLDHQSLTGRLHIPFVPQWLQLPFLLVLQCVILVPVEVLIVHLLSYLFTGWSPALGNKFLKEGLGFFYTPNRLYTEGSHVLHAVGG